MADKPDDKGGKNRRKFERITVLWSGSLACEGQVVDCVIVNVSPSRQDRLARCASSTFNGRSIAVSAASTAAESR